jgi:hypothetical protein
LAVGTSLPGALTATVAVRVTGSTPASGVAAETVRAVPVDALLTVRVPLTNWKA